LFVGSPSEHQKFGFRRRQIIGLDFQTNFHRFPWGNLSLKTKKLLVYLQEKFFRFIW